MFFLTAVPVSAASDKLYTAGIPDGYPVEYYDSQEKRYAGILPDIWEEIEERTGIQQQYVESGPIDERIGLAENDQIEVFCDYGLGQEEQASLQSGGSYTMQGSGSTSRIPKIRLVYTEIMDTQMQKELETAWQQMAADGALDTIYSAYIDEVFRGNGISPTAFWIIGGTGGVFLFLLALGLIKYSRQKKQLQRLEAEDPVTGGMSFSLWKKRYREIVREENRWHYAVIQITSGMEQISRIYGYEEEEKALKLLFTVLEKHVRPEGEIFARFHEFQYIVLLQYTGSKDIRERITKLFRETEELFQKKEKKYFLNLHAGVYRFEGMPNTVLEALQFSEVAMDYAVEQELDISYYNLEVEQGTISNYTMEHEAIHGLMNREFVMFLQPIMDGRSGRMLGAEALVRWQSPLRGLLKPEDFFHIMDRKHLSARMNMNILEQGCQLIQKEKGKGHEIRLLFNFSQENLLDEYFADKVWEVVRQYAVGKHQVIIQMNQLKHIVKYPQFSKTAAKLLEYGFDICIGSIDMGRAFYEALRNGITAVKLGPDLIGHLDEENVRTVVKNLIHMCRELSLQVFCIGVETEEQAAYLREQGCAFVSGFYYYRPVSQEIFTDLLDSPEGLK